MLSRYPKILMLTTAVGTTHSRFIMQVAPRLWYEIVPLVSGLVRAVEAVVFTREILHLAHARLPFHPRNIVLWIGRSEHRHHKHAAETANLLADESSLEGIALHLPKQCHKVNVNNE